MVLLWRYVNLDVACEYVTVLVHSISDPAMVVLIDASANLSLLSDDN
jgi:hypothetical protein